MPSRRLILRSFQSPGDIVMLTAAVRDLHRAHPGEFETDVRTTAPEIWQHNPHITPLCEGDPGVESIDMHYPLIHESNQRPYHFIHGYPQHLEQQLGTRIPVTVFHGDIHLSEEERESSPTTIFPPFVRGGRGDGVARQRTTRGLSTLPPSPNASGSSSPAAGTTSPPSGGTRAASRRSLIISAARSRSCSAAWRGTGTRPSTV